MRSLIIALVITAIAPLAGAEMVTANVSTTNTSGTTTVTRSFDLIGGQLRGRVVKYNIAWTSDASGNATASFEACGLISRIVFNPDDSAAPTNLYDVVINDEDSIDVLEGEGANLSSSATTESLAVNTDTGNTLYFREAICGTLTLQVTNAGNAKQGVIRVYVEQ